jgi:PAS domain S-box-containing protein
MTDPKDLTHLNKKQLSDTTLKLKESEEKYRHLFEHHSAAKLIIDPETGKIIDLNFAAIEFYGWSKDALKAMHISQISILSASEIASKMKLVQTKGNKYFEFEQRIADGTIKDVGVDSGLVTIGGRGYLHVIIHDITNRKRAEKALIESKNRFQAIADNSGGWIWEVDNNGLYTYASEHSYKLIGYTQKEIVNKKYFYDFFVENEREKLKTEAFKIFQSKQSFNGFENHIIHKDGRRIIIETYGLPLLDDDGNLKGYLGVDKDVTEKKNAQTALIERTKELEEFNRLMVDRELRIIQIKEEVNTLCEVLKIPKRYPEDWK